MQCKLTVVGNRVAKMMRAISASRTTTRITMYCSKPADKYTALGEFLNFVEYTECTMNSN